MATDCIFSDVNGNFGIVARLWQREARQLTLLGKECVRDLDENTSAITGKRVGACVQCPYHGWQYDGDGQCTHIPTLAEGASIPARARVDAYPVERVGPYVENHPAFPNRVNVEFISANPTGPLNIVSARAAAVGSTLHRVLSKAGYRPSSEFYVNNAGSLAQDALYVPPDEATTKENKRRLQEALSESPSATPAAE